MERKSNRYLANVVDLDRDKVIPLLMPRDLANRFVVRYERNGTLIDRDFELSRTGEGLDTVYDLDAGVADRKKIDKYTPLNLRVSYVRMESGVDPDALRTARLRAGLTQHELARLIGVAGGERISRWELGTSTPRPQMLHRLAVALNVGADELLERAGGPPDLRRLRTSAGLSARTVAVRAHMSLPTYIRWEAGGVERLPSMEALEPLAKVLDVTAADVVAAIAIARSNAR